MFCLFIISPPLAALLASAKHERRVTPWVFMVQIWTTSYDFLLPLNFIMLQWWRQK